MGCTICASTIQRIRLTAEGRCNPERDQIKTGRVSEFYARAYSAQFLRAIIVIREYGGRELRELP